MTGRPLWDIVKRTLTHSENLQEFTHFLRLNSRRHHHGHSINFEAMFLRVAVLTIFYQAHFITLQWWMVVYFGVKVLLVFKLQLQLRQALEAVGMLLAFHLLDFLTSFLPFLHPLYWYLNAHYLLFGSEEKYLSLNTMLLPLDPLSKSVLIRYSPC